MRDNQISTDAEEGLGGYEVDIASGRKMTKVGSSEIRMMLAEHGFRIQWIAEQLDVPVETVEQFAAELRAKKNPAG